jgi:hypothetical protein
MLTTIIVYSVMAFATVMVCDLTQTVINCWIHCWKRYHALSPEALPTKASEDLGCLTVRQPKQPEIQTETVIEPPLADEKILKALPTEASENLGCATAAQPKQPEIQTETEVEPPLSDEKIQELEMLAPQFSAKPKRASRKRKEKETSCVQ